MRCEQCGEEVEVVEMVDGVLMCDGCAWDYRDMHPNMEDAVARAEYYRDSGAFGCPDR
jgi:hypothetical protein